MTLDQYLSDRPETETAFSLRIGADQSTVHRLRKAGQIPGKDTMARIFEATDGNVTANDFFGIQAPDARAAA